ncbi:MAG TPA: NUDIX hydrolase [Propionicimonas sp.]|nr:NUDIX hydrolase [Propionicimonas sp.]
MLPITITDGVAVVALDPARSGAEAAAAVQAARDAALADPEVHRVEMYVTAPNRDYRRALHQAGFRLDGVARARRRTAVGLADEWCYSLLRSDPIDGREAFTAVMNSVTARKRVIAHLLLTDSQDRVCILQTTFKPDFELPGGILEIGESPRDGLLREVREELDHTVEVGRLLVVDWLVPYLGWEDAVELIFDAGTLTDPDLLRPDGHEIEAVHWLDLTAAAARMAPFAQGRLHAAWSARQESQTFYLEGGARIS